MTEAPPAAVKSADRVLDLFELLAQGGREMSHSDIAEVLQIPKSSLTQLLKNLIARGYVEVSANGRLYRLGQTLLNLSRNAAGVHDLVLQAETFLAEITSEVGESSALNRRRGDHSEVAATVLGPARLVAHMRLGDLAPLYATSGGKAILAHLPSAVRDEYLSRVRFEPATPATLKTAAALKKQLAAVRDTGFAYSFQEWTPGIVGVAVAVIDAMGAPLGSINVAIPATRFDADMRQRAERSLLRVVNDLGRHALPRARA